MGSSREFNRLCERLRVESSKQMKQSSDSTAVLDNAKNVIGFSNKLRHARPSSISLNISTFTTHTPGLESLLRHVQTCSRLCDVRLAGSDYRLSASALTTVVRLFLQAIGKNRNIERVALYNIILEVDTLARIIGSSSSAISHMSLASCYISKSDDYPTSIKTLCHAMKANTSIESLHLISLEDRLLVPLLEQMQTHTALRQLDVTYGSVHAAEAIAGVLVSPQTPFLEHLILRDSPLLSLEPIVRSVLRRSGGLRRLDILNCDIDGVSANLLRMLFCSSKQLESVALCDLDLEDDTNNLRDLLAGLAGCASLRSLQVRRLQGGDNSKKKCACYEECLAPFLQEATQLRSVDLDRHILAALESKMDMTKLVSFYGRKESRTL